MTTQTMIEKMCRAVWKHERDTKQHDEPFQLSWYEPSMRAALQALREPTEEMINQVSSFVEDAIEDPDVGFCYASYGADCCVRDPKALTRALVEKLIDAALQEKA